MHPPPPAAPPGATIGIDFGTSTTVAVLRWPDGRTRPLLFGGSPLLPSAVYADRSGRLVVGSDAVLLGRHDPGSFEPTPKGRIDDGTVLLGARAVPVVELFAAVLRTVADKAVEACGRMPHAVLTHPATWGATRRGILAAAAARAGWPAAELVAEPIAAARFYTTVLGRPLPPGETLAVFDFGAGTLDVAAVAGNRVVATGGLDDLGGLDIDAALAEHLGRTIAQRRPDLWQALSQPADDAERRQRLVFRDEVRAAKEMLSRASVAPVAVPGLDAIHLTRSELEAVAGPLLDRAVAVTRSVVGRPYALFLVGGSSRLPIVARRLHEATGVAPTVLEQPELPVAEGALPLGLAAPVVPAPRAPHPPRRRRRWLVGAGAVAGLLVLSGLYQALTVPFGELQRDREVRTTATPALTRFNGDVVYLGATRGRTIEITALDTVRKDQRLVAGGDAPDWTALLSEHRRVVAVGAPEEDRRTLFAADFSTEPPRTWTGTVRAGDRVSTHPAGVVVTGTDRVEMLSYETGRPERTWPVDGARVVEAADHEGFVLVRGNGEAVYQPYGSGWPRSVTVPDPGGVLGFVDGTLYATTAIGEGYTVTAYPPGRWRQPPTAPGRPRWIGRCGTRMCILVNRGGETDTELVGYDADGTERWRYQVPGVDLGRQWFAATAGVTAVVHTRDDRPVTTAITDSVKRTEPGVGRPVEVGFAKRGILLFPDWPGDAVGPVTLRGFDMGRQQRVELGTLAIRAAGCDWTATRLACPIDGGFAVWRFRG